MTVMQSVFATVRSSDAPFTVEPGTIEPPGAGELLIAIAGVGFCHTDLSVRSQSIPFPLPAVLGHEGSGRVVAIGADVEGFAIGDPVVLSFASCGACVNCTRGEPAYCREFFVRNFAGDAAAGPRLCDGHGEKLVGGFFGQSSFASHALVAARCAVKLADDAQLEMMGPLGCGIQTGAGAVLNALKAAAGSSLAIFGAGSVGLSALLAAHIAGCGEMIVVDPLASRRAAARELGATLVIDPRETDPVAAIRDATGGGADYTLECTGIPDVLRQAFEALAVPGVCGVVGAPPFGSQVSLDVNMIVAGRTIRGIIEGDSDPRRFIPQLIDHWRAGRFPFDRLIETYPLDGINRAVEDMHQGRVIKPVFVLSPSQEQAR